MAMLAKESLIYWNNLCENGDCMKETKYNYVFMNIATDYIAPCFMPLRKYKGVRVYEHAFESGRILQKLFFYHWSKKLNDIIKLPFKSLWFKRMCVQDFKNTKPVCYVFYSGKYIFEEKRLYQYIKTLNPDNKCIVYFGDLISKRDIDIVKMKKCCDEIITYDSGEAKVYGIRHFDSLGYGAIMDTVEKDDFVQDIYFLGYAKDRLEEIYTAYKNFSEKGFRCKFIICGVPKEKQWNVAGLIYSSPISYKENIQNVIDSKCILELIQGGSNAPTLRLMESLVYKRKLITNNVELLRQPYYDQNNMRVITKADENCFEFLRKPINYITFDTGMLDPYHRIEFLENLFAGEKINE